MNNYSLSKDEVLEKFNSIRQNSENICSILEIEDYIPQPITDVSPPKWHLGHTTWFFEQFILVKYDVNYKPYNDDFAFIFNSYYNNMGERIQRKNRGFMTRPTVKDVYNYRKYVNDKINLLISQNTTQEILKLIEIGINHEEQHQELLTYDIKYIFGVQPTYPVIGNYYKLQPENREPEWININDGFYNLGAIGNSFSYDNEMPHHKVWLPEYQISNKLITNAEYIEFIEDNSYHNFNLWHEEALYWLKENSIELPLYWKKKNGKYLVYDYDGLNELKPELPIMHLSFYEAFAFCEWAGYRLPNEYEWEIASDKFAWGQLWEWTQSSYSPYPGFKKPDGALGEYNGKFMVNQYVLKGASVGTPNGHSRKTYRNFFHSSSRWIFSGLRVSKK